jgi:hypothetical protein
MSYWTLYYKQRINQFYFLILMREWMNEWLIYSVIYLKIVINYLDRIGDKENRGLALRELKSRMVTAMLGKL